jgi:Outer membrane protein beta-barrel domain
MQLFRGLALSTLVFSSALALAQPALAQNTNNASKEDNGIGIGAELMAAFPSVSNLGTGLDAKTGYGFGLWVGGNKNGLIGFTGEFIYLKKKIENTAGTTSATRNALEIPAVFHVNLGPRTKNAVSGYAVIGPVFTINVNNKLTGGLTGSNFAGADIGIIGGGGIEFFRVGIELRGNWGMRNISSAGTTANSKDKAVELLGKFRFN